MKTRETQSLTDFAFCQTQLTFISKGAVSRHTLALGRAREPARRQIFHSVVPTLRQALTRRPIQSWE
ncbi:hypothetical protein AM571_PA00151 (plasmid) [Rhizobium etli 8C-3]|uniref:Uncharacterized protein n=1 Tax=Rhizobium etli 8C-3 TaxID=538025 RepID=A0A1L5PA18_RHIET|nr:hypothetical protein AM571_PA00151 [Rhizobium etli 8C-3]